MDRYKKTLVDSLIIASNRFTKEMKNMGFKIIWNEHSGHIYKADANTATCFPIGEVSIRWEIANGARMDGSRKEEP